MSKIPYKNLRYIYKTIKTILISIIATYFLFLLIHQYLDKTDSVDFFFNNAKSLYNLREVVLDILFTRYYRGDRGKRLIRKVSKR